ncbi:uroporphyrinogen decarboxylase [Candidatus Berkiella aquae]|uniref:Uroporphyrinogen decarboxylase n=1 Tax=Candidatus Berkiella aquae TaxID=295108 RepID=A0A0Q9YWJ8_9GAMM|nr:uroporphyrinogen decarboxylase [Candidatus Berkiella aquae]MCS5710037.1 uroporphyrinogen decarboxylase [Candidatus Berkiella aquae]
MNSSFRFIRALKRQPVDSTPVWFMRQAGRYLPEYRAMRERVGGFLGMCQNPEIAAEITLQPLKRFPLDAAIIFSDILTIPDAMGLGLYFATHEGPHFQNPIRDAKAVAKLPIPCPEADLGYVMDAVRLTVKECGDKTPVIGFCGSPWTVATYMVEGQGSRTFSIIKAMMMNEPLVLKGLLQKVTQASCQYLEAQIQAGVEAVMVFDTWGGALSGAAYHEFSLHYMQEIVRYLKAKTLTQSIPIILFTKQGGQWLESIADTGCDAIGIDWTQDLANAKARVGRQVALQGNLDPTVLYARPDIIQREVQGVLANYGYGSGHIFNLGHGIFPDVNPEHVAAMIEAVKKYSPRYHQAEMIKDNAQNGTV